MNDLANLFKPNWTDQSNPIPALLAMADASLVTLKLAEVVATLQREATLKVHDQLVLSSEQPYGPVGYGPMINAAGDARMHLDQVIRAISDKRDEINRWRVNVKAGQSTHNASNFPALPQVLVEYLGALSLA